MKIQFKDVNGLETFFRQRYTPFSVVFLKINEPGPISMIAKFDNIDDLIKVVQTEIDNNAEKMEDLYFTYNTMYAHELRADDLWHVFCSFFENEYDMSIYN